MINPCLYSFILKNVLKIDSNGTIQNLRSASFSCSHLMSWPCCWSISKHQLLAIFLQELQWACLYLGSQQQNSLPVSKGEAWRTGPGLPSQTYSSKDVRLSTLFSMKRSDSTVTHCHAHSLFFIFASHLFLASCFCQVIVGAAETLWEYMTLNLGTSTVV